jgi:CDP-diglyceride synthetase
MDLRRLRKGEWITAISGIALFVSLFLPWWELLEGAYYDRSTGSSGYAYASVADVSAWEALSVTDVLLALLAVGAVAIWVVTALARNTAPGIAADTLIVPFALVMAVVCLVRVLNLPDAFEPASDFVDVAYGAWIGLAATFGVLVGDLIAMRDERLSRDGRPTDQTGVPVAQPLQVEKLPGPPAA